MNLPVELIPKKNVVLSGFTDKRAAFAYINAVENTMIFISSINITSNMELNIIGTYQVN